MNHHISRLLPTRTSKELPVEPEAIEPVYEHHDYPSIQINPSMTTNEMLQHSLMRAKMIDAASDAAPYAILNISMKQNGAVDATVLACSTVGV